MWLPRRMRGCAARMRARVWHDQSGVGNARRPVWPSPLISSVMGSVMGIPGLARRACCAFLVLVVGGCGSSSSASHSVASVSGTGEIALAQLTHWTSVLLGTGRARANRGQAARTALDLLIKWEWTAAEAREERVAVTPTEARARIAQHLADVRAGVNPQRIPGQSQLEAFLMGRRIGDQDKVMLVRMALLDARVRHEHTMRLAASIPIKEVVAYYRHHLSEFTVTERRDIRAIMNRSRAKIAEAKREMQAGVNFRSIERRFNTSIEGGLRLGRGPGSQKKQYERDFFSAPAHVLIGPRKEGLYYVFEVFHIRPAHVRPLGEVEHIIRERLATVKLEQGATTRNALWRKRTTCEAGLRSASCGQYVRPS